jgi:protein ImuA
MSRIAELSVLRERIRHLERPARHGVLPFGVAAIDHALPGGGLALGAVHEILGAGGDEEDGAAAAGFAAGILARLSSLSVIPGQRVALGPEPMNTDTRPDTDGLCSWVPGSRAAPTPRNDNPASSDVVGPILWCLKRPDLYGPGLMAHGLDPARLVLVGARRDDDILWAVEEGLREAGLAAVVGEIGHLPMVAGRRLQLAAERSGVTALLLRRWRDAAQAAAERDQPSAALTRWRVAALPSVPLLPLPLLKSPLPHRGRGGAMSGGEGGVMSGGDNSRGWGLGVGRPRWRVALLRVRGGAPGAWDVEVADATGHVSLSAGLADRPAAPARVGAEPVVRRAG